MESRGHLSAFRPHQFIFRLINLKTYQTPPPIPPKFRVWDKESSELSYDSERFFIRTNGSLGDWYDGDETRSSDSYVVQLIVALRDKNDKEMYVGDIIRYSPFNTTDKNYQNILAIVPSVNAYHWFEELQIMMEDHKNKCEVTIVGNIFENPELLKEYNDWKEKDHDRLIKWARSQ
jgi:YopX protein